MGSRKNSTMRPAARQVEARPTIPRGKSTKFKRYGKTGHKPVRCLDQVCGVCGGKGHSAEVCAKVLCSEKVIYVNVSVTVSGCRPGRNSCIGGLVKEHAGTICLQKVERKNRVSPVEKNAVTPP